MGAQGPYFWTLADVTSTSTPASTASKTPSFPRSRRRRCWSKRRSNGVLMARSSVPNNLEAAYLAALPPDVGRNSLYNPLMPLGLKRYQHEGEDHFVTFSCYGRDTYLGTSPAKDTFLLSLELTRQNYGFEVLGYVVMPEPVHLLVSEPPDHEVSLATAIQALKISVSRRLTERPFWQRRYYDFKVVTHNKRVEVALHAPQSDQTQFGGESGGLDVVIVPA